MSSLTECHRNSSFDILIDHGKPSPLHETNENERDNIIEPYLKSTLRPLNIIQNVFFCAKYRIKGQVIKPISRLYSAVSVIFYFLIEVYLYSIFFLAQHRTIEDDFEHFFLLNYHFVLFSIGGFVNVFFNLKQKYNNVLYVLKIQNVHRVLKLDETCFKRSIVYNWVCVLAINCFHISWTFIEFFAFEELDILIIISAYMCIRFDFNAIYATRCLGLMTDSLKILTANLQMSTYISDSLDKNFWSAMFGCYVDITEVFQIVEKTFEPMILFYLVHTCSNSLLDIWVRVKLRPTVPNNELKYTLLTCSSLTWVMKNLLIITFLCVECEKYYSAIKEIKWMCTQMTASESSSANQKTFCRNILRVQDATFKKLRICGLFAVDASLPLRVIAFITTYTIVLLQFVFL